MMITLKGGFFRPVLGGGGAEWHAKREDHSADCEQMQINCAAATELLDAPRDPLFEIVPPPACPSGFSR